MKLTVDRLSMKDAGALVKRATAKRATLPALSGIIVHANGAGSLTMSATDLEQTVTVQVPAHVIEPGSVLLPGRTLLDLLKTGGDYVTLTVDDDGQRATIDTGAAATLRTMPIGDYPSLPGDGYGVSGTGWTLTEQDVDRLRRVAPSASSDEARPVLTGVFFAPSGEVAATDSYRLARAMIRPEFGEVLGGLLIPSHVAATVAGWKLAGRTVRVETDIPTDTDQYGRRRDGLVTFAGYHVTGPKRAPRVATVWLTTRTIEGTFPNHEQLWPDPVGELVTVDPGELVAALRDLGPLLTQANTPANLSVTLDGRLRVHAGNQEVGEVETFVSIVGTVPAEEWAVAMNGPFLRGLVEAVAGGSGEPVTLAVRDPLKPVVIAGNAGVRALQMPMRVS